MTDRMRERWARAALAAVVGLAIVETMTAAVVYRDRIDADDWRALRETLDQVDGTPVFLATPWLGPRARMEVPALAALEAVAPPDLRDQRDFVTIGLNGATWSEHLERDLEGMSRPDEIERREVGAFTLTHHRAPQAKVRTWDLLASSTVEVEVEATRCRRRGRGWQCGEGTVTPKVVEIDHRPRRCLSVDVEDGMRVKIHDPNVVTGDELRGHVSFHDFNGRLRSDAPLRLSIQVDGAPVFDSVVTDEQGWLPFSIETNPGRHAMTIELLVTARGTWDRPGYRPGHPRPACVELRALEAGS